MAIFQWFTFETQKYKTWSYQLASWSIPEVEVGTL